MKEKVHPLSLFVFLLVGCNQQQTIIRPEIRCKNCALETLPGDVIPIDAKWSAKCSDSFSNFTDQFLSKTEANPPNSMACAEQKFVLELSCTSPCRLQKGEFKNFDFGVVPRDSGPFSFTLKMKNSENRVVKTFESPLIEVRAPDGIGLYCYYFYEENQRRFEPCDSRPLSRAHPYVMPVYEFGTKVRALRAFKLNGVAHRSQKKREWKDRPALSLESVLISKDLDSLDPVELILEKDATLTKTFVWIK